MASWDVFLTDVLVHCPSAPIPTVRRVLRRSARAFCQRTFAWKVWLPCEQAASPDLTDYTIALPTGAELVRLEQVVADGVPVTTTMQDVPADDWTDEDTAAEMPDRQAVTADLLTITITAGPLADTAVVKAQVALQPTLAAAACAFELLATRYFEAIVDGALARLFAMKGATFGDNDEAAKFGAMFEAAIGRAVNDVSRGHTRSRRRPTAHWC
ncbi:MAG TPA: hypothetical protein PLH95_03585 [Thauera aminoaromatica]|nr:hypothetical protein [Thauera aminoaromatica]